MATQDAVEAGIAGCGAVTDLNIDAYRIKMKTIGHEDRDQLHQMTVGVHWPHRADDLDLIISLGKGHIGTDEIGRPVCTAISFPFGDDFAMIGMMTTTPRLQTLGAGRWLLKTVLADCGGRDLRLNATRAGYTLYQEAGFVPVGPVRQMQGLARAPEMPPVAPGLEIREVQSRDRDAMLALDAHAFGAVRESLFDRLMEAPAGTVAVRNGERVGFALHRRFGKGMVIGPVVAEDDLMAMQLIAPLIRQNAGVFARMDTPVDSAALLSFLNAAGLHFFDTVTEMRIGPHRRATRGPLTYGLAAHSLG